MNINQHIIFLLVFSLFFIGCSSDNANNTSEENTSENSGTTLPTKNKVETMSLSEFQETVRQGGDVLYVYNFWATWCKPCIEEMPYFEQVASDMKDKKFKLVFVSIDNFKNSYNKVQRFVNKKDIKASVILLEYKDQNKLISGIDKSWNGTIPATLFVDNKNQTKLFYQKEFSYQELQAIVTPLLPVDM